MNTADHKTAHRPNRVRYWRQRRELTQGDLAKRIKCSVVQISRLETGARQLTMESLKQLSSALDVPIADLLSPTENPWQLSEEERRLIAAIRATGGRTLDAVTRVAEIMQGSLVEAEIVALHCGHHQDTEPKT